MDKKEIENWKKWRDKNKKTEVDTKRDIKHGLSIGCRRVIVKEGWKAVDVTRPPWANRHPERFVQVKLTDKRLPFKDNEFEYVLASHVFEHIDINKRDATLKDWIRVLKPGGILHIRVPNVAAYCRLFSKGIWDMEWLSVNLHGLQDSPGEYHYVSYDVKYLLAVVRRAIGKQIDILFCEPHGRGRWRVADIEIRMEVQKK